MTGQLPVDAGYALTGVAPWRDPDLSPAARAEALIPLMSLEEKIAQLVGRWGASFDPYLVGTVGAAYHQRRLQSSVRIDPVVPRQARKA